VTGERARGATLYTFAAVLLLSGGLWFERAAPERQGDGGIATARATVERLLPDLPQSSESETLVLVAGEPTERRTTMLRGGSYTVTMLCLGEGQVRVKLSEMGEDTGKAVHCSSGAPEPVELALGLAEELYLSLSAETSGPAVFRWRATRIRTY
jgi:hypothetical protein